MILVYGSNGGVYAMSQTRERMIPQCFIPTAKHDGGNFQAWECFASSGVGQLHIIGSTSGPKKTKQSWLTYILPSTTPLNIYRGHSNNEKAKHSVSGEETFWNTVKSCWDNISLAESLPGRVHAVIEAEVEIPNNKFWNSWTFFQSHQILLIIIKEYHDMWNGCLSEVH